MTVSYLIGKIRCFEIRANPRQPEAYGHYARLIVRCAGRVELRPVSVGFPLRAMLYAWHLAASEGKLVMFYEVDFKPAALIPQHVTITGSPANQQTPAV